MNTRPSQHPSLLTPQKLGTPQRPVSKGPSLRRFLLCGARLPALLLTFVVASLRSLLRSSTRFAVLAVSLCSALYSSFDILHAASPPELTVLRQQYDKVLAERVTAPFDAGLAELNTKYTAGLDRFIGEAKTAGELKTVLALEAEKKRLADKLPLPAEDDDSTPESLKKLRVIYREQFKKLEEARTANHAALLPAYTAKLAALEVTLTKADRVSEAAEVLTYREGLAVGAPAAPTIATSSSPTKPTTATVPDTKTPAMKPSEAAAANRQLAEWCLNNRHEIDIEVDRRIMKISSLQDLPKDKFEVVSIEYRSTLPAGAPGPMPWSALQAAPNITSIYLDFGTEGVDVTMDDLAHLGALKQLKKLQFAGKTNWVDFDVKKLPVLPELQSLTFLKAMQSAEMAVLHEKFPKLSSIALGSYGNAEIPPQVFGQLSLWSGLHELRLDGPASHLTAAHIDSLTQLPELHALILYPLRVVIDPSISKLKNVDQVSLHYNFTPENCHAVCGITSLATLQLNNNNKHTDADLSALSSLTKLTDLKLTNMTGLTDASAAHITALKTLASLDLSGSPFTDAILPELAKMKKLKKLSVRKTSITEAGAAAFKKQRPDIEFTR